MATNPKSTVKAVLQAYDKKEEWDFEAHEPAPAPAISPLIVSYNVEMSVLREVERACAPHVVATGVLIAVARNKDGLPKMDREQVCLDLKRDICPDGRYVSHLLCNQYDQDDIVFRQLFPNKEHQDALALGYPQGAGNLVSLLGLTFMDKTPNIAANVAAKLTAGSAFARDEHNLNLTTVASGLLIPLSDSRGDVKNYTIPGEIFVTAKTRGFAQGGGVKILSASTSNQLLEKLLKHKRGNPSLQVYGYELLNNSGELDPAILALAIERAKDEERAARANLEGAIAQFKAYQAKQQDEGVQARLKDIEDKTVRHTRKRGHDYERGRLINGDYVVTLDTAMAIAVYRDLPAVLSGEKQIEECPLLLHTIVWCGDPELSADIKGALLEKQQDQLAANSDSVRLPNLLKDYAKGDDKANVAQQRQEYKALCSKRETLIAALNKQEKQKKNVRMGLGTGTPVAGMLALTIVTIVTGGLALVPILGVLGVIGILGAIGFAINEGVARVRQNRAKKELADVRKKIALIKTMDDFQANEDMQCSAESCNEQRIACEQEERYAQTIAQQRISESDLDFEENPDDNEHMPLLPKGKENGKAIKELTSSAAFFPHHTDKGDAKIAVEAADKMMKPSKLLGQAEGSNTRLKGH